MRWKPKELTKWHRWFAWYPVWSEEDEWVWLEWVNRQIINGVHTYARCKAVNRP